MRELEERLLIFPIVSVAKNAISNYMVERPGLRNKKKNYGDFHDDTQQCKMKKAVEPKPFTSIRVRCAGCAVKLANSYYRWPILSRFLRFRQIDRS